MIGVIALGIHGIVNYITAIFLIRRKSRRIETTLLAVFLLLQALSPIVIAIGGEKCIEWRFLLSVICFVMVFGIALRLFDRDPDNMLGTWYLAVFSSFLTLIALSIAIFLS